MRGPFRALQRAAGRCGIVSAMRTQRKTLPDLDIAAMTNETMLDTVLAHYRCNRDIVMAEYVQAGLARTVDLNAGR